MTVLTTVPLDEAVLLKRPLQGNVLLGTGVAKDVYTLAGEHPTPTDGHQPERVFPYYECESGQRVFREGEDWFYGILPGKFVKSYTCPAAGDPRRPPSGATWRKCRHPDREVAFTLLHPEGEDTPTPVAPQGACHLYVAIDSSPDRFVHDVHSASALITRDESDVESAGIDVVIGPAYGHNVVSKERVPVLLWFGTGANVLPSSTTLEIAPETTSSPSNVFIDELFQKGASVDVAVVCMAFGAEWAATRLVQIGVARCAVWITMGAESAQVNRAQRLDHALLLASQMLSRARSSKRAYCASDLPTLVDNIDAQMGLAHGAVAPALDGTVLDEGILGLLERGSGGSLKYDMPRGSFRSSSCDDWEEVPQVDLLHLQEVQTLQNRVIDCLKVPCETPGPRFVFVVPAWPEHEENAADHLSGLLHAAIGGCFSLPRGQQSAVRAVHACQLNEKTEAVMTKILGFDTAVIWFRAVCKESVQRWFNKDWHRRLQQSVIVCDVPSPADLNPIIQCLISSQYDCSKERDIHSVTTAPARQIANFCKFGLLRIENSAHLSLHELREVLTAATPSNIRTPWIDGLYIDGADIIVGVVAQSLLDLHHLRDFVVIRHAQLEKTLRTRFPSSDDTTLAVAVDTSMFAKHYMCILESFDRLTPHQMKQYQEWGSHKIVHIQGPAGSGKTFLALHRIVCVLLKGAVPREAKRRVLIIAPRMALLVKYGQWICRRIQERTCGSQWQLFFSNENSDFGVWGLSEVRCVLASVTITTPLLAAMQLTERELVQEFGEPRKIVLCHGDRCGFSTCVPAPGSAKECGRGPDTKVPESSSARTVDGAFRLPEWARSVAKKATQIAKARFGQEIRMEPEYDLVVVDEAHHVFSTKLMGQENSFSRCVARVMEDDPCVAICSDESQSHAESSVTLPHETAPVLELTEVVRNSRNVFDGSKPFRTAGTIRSYCNVSGPPLFAHILPPHAEFAPGGIHMAYARKVHDAVGDLQTKFPKIPIHRHLVILVSTDDAVIQLTTAFRRMNSVFNLVSVLEAVNEDTTRLMESTPNATVVIDTVDNFIGMESLIVIAVGLDTDSDVALEREIAFNRVYRAFTRAHLFVVVVQEYHQNGCLAYLATADLLITEDADNRTNPFAQKSNDRDSTENPTPHVDLQSSLDDTIQSGTFDAEAAATMPVFENTKPQSPEEDPDETVSPKGHFLIQTRVDTVTRVDQSLWHSTSEDVYVKLPPTFNPLSGRNHRVQLAWPPPSIISQGSKAIRAFLNAVQERSAPLVRSRVMFVGDGGSGKTTLKTALLLRGAGARETLLRLRRSMIETIELRWTEADLQEWVDTDLAHEPGFFSSCPRTRGLTGKRWLRLSPRDVSRVFGHPDTFTSDEVVAQLTAVLHFLTSDPDEVPNPLYGVLLSIPHVWTEGVELDTRWEEYTLWDFPGQMELYPSHRLFLACETVVYVLVVNGRTRTGEVVGCMRQLHRWLSLIRSGLRDGGSKVEARIVVTHTDSLTIVDRNAILHVVHEVLQSTYADHFNFGERCYATTYDTANGGDVDAVRDELARLRSVLPPNRPFPASYQAICDDVLALARKNARWPVVPISAIDWRGHDEALVCLEDLGFVRRANDQVILEPVTWLSTLMSAFLHPLHGIGSLRRPHTAAEHQQDHIASVLVDTATACYIVNLRHKVVDPEHESEVLLLLAHFDMCFSPLDDGKYVFPSLLPRVTSLPSWLKRPFENEMEGRRYVCSNTHEFIQPTFSSLLMKQLLAMGGRREGVPLFFGRGTVVIGCPDQSGIVMHMTDDDRAIDIVAFGSSRHLLLSGATVHLASALFQNYRGLAVAKRRLTRVVAIPDSPLLNNLCDHPLLGRCTVNPVTTKIRDGPLCVVPEWLADEYECALPLIPSWFQDKYESRLSHFLHDVRHAGHADLLVDASVVDETWAGKE